MVRPERAGQGWGDNGEPAPLQVIEGGGETDEDIVGLRADLAAAGLLVGGAGGRREEDPPATAADEMIQRLGLPHAVSIGPMLAEIADVEDVAASALGNIEAARLRRKLRALPLLERKILCLRYGVSLKGTEGEELSYAAIGRRLGLSRGSVWYIAEHGLKRLRKAYGIDAEAA